MSQVNDSPRRSRRRFVTAAAAFICVAVRACQPKKIRVLVMKERNQSPLVGFRFEHEPLGSCDANCLLDAAAGRRGDGRARPGKVAAFASGGASQFSMAIDTLSVIGPL